MSSIAPVAIGLPPNHFYSRSFGDSLAHLFWSGEDLLCGILPGYDKTFATMMSKGLYRDLHNAGLIASSHVIGSSDTYPSILSVATPETLSYGYEWSYATWRMALLFWIELYSFLADRGYTLRNPHAWNLIFDGKGFRYLNPASIVELDSTILQRSWDKTLRFFARPLVMAAAGRGNLARHLLRDIHEGVPPGVLSAEKESLWKLDMADLSQTWAILREHCHAIEIQERPVKWNEYYEERRFQSGSSWNLKRDHLLQTLEEIRPNQVLDLGGNTGYYSKAAASQGYRTVCVDVDDVYVSRLYRDLRTDGANILPLVVDFTNPAPGLGVDNAWLPAATERLRSGLVFGFALEHHLVFGKYRLNFDQFARGIWSFCSKCALVEFISPYDNLRPAEWRPDCLSWYHAEGFREAFLHYFGRVEEICVAPDNRRLFRCDDPKARRDHGL